MKVLETRIYRGPNQYALWPVIRLRLDLGELEWFPTARLPGFSDRLVQLIPTLCEHTCSYGEPGGFVRRLKEDDGTWLGHVMEHVAIELQCLAGTPVTFGKTRGHGLPPGQYHVVYSFEDEAVGMAAGRLAMRLIHHLLPARMDAHDPAPLDFPAELEALIELARSRALDPATAALVKAAEDRGIPWSRLDGQSLVALGHGKYQRRIQGGLAVEIAADENLTQSLLGQLGSECRIHVVGGKIVAVLPGEEAGSVIESLFSAGASSRVPLVAVAGALGKSTVTRIVGHILKVAGHTVGMASSEGVYIDGKLALGGDRTGPESSALVLHNPTVDAAVLEVAHGGVARSGLGWRRCDVSAVLNLVADPADELAQAARIVAEVAEGFCVLNADDERVVALAEHVSGEPIWVTLDPGNERVRRHIRRGGRAVALETGLNGRLLALYQGEEQIALLWARQIPLAQGGKAEHDIQNAMFAAAIAFGLGVDAGAIRQGLRSFEMPIVQAVAEPRRRAVG
jgi:hypothetical protein